MFADCIELLYLWLQKYSQSAFNIDHLVMSMCRVLEKGVCYDQQKEKRVAENEMVGYHHRFNGHELGQTLGEGEGQEGLACCSPWGHEDLVTTW